MGKIGRRAFLKGALASSAALAGSAHSRVLGANGDIRVAVVGFRSQGRNHINWLRGLPGVRVVALCDADRDVLAREEKAAKDRNEKADGYTDVRKLLEDKSIDAVTTATPDHWHALVTIWACQAGKDVYVEKPLCHNLWEGRKMVEAAEKHQRIVQFGNQNHGHRTGPARLDDPKLGRIRIAYASLNRMRQSIGKVGGPQKPPASLDYNLWLGPAPMEPLRRKTLHYDWHWVWPTGTGELGNNGVYPLDELRLRLGQSVLPKRVMSLGGRYLFGDDGETPNTQIALFQYEPGPLVIFELRNLPSKKGPKTTGSKVQWESGTSGLPGTHGKAGDTHGFRGHQGHLANWIAAVRSRKVGDLRAPLIEGHLSTALVHMANVSFRLGTPHPMEGARDAVQDRGTEAMAVLDGFREHLTADGVDWAKAKVAVGPWLEMDPEREQFVGASDTVRKANELLRRDYRKPFVVPEKV